MKHLLSILLLLLPFVLFAQMDKGEVFKHSATTPYEDLSKSGVVIVTNGMYGLTFDDDQIPQTAKDKVQAFFDQRNSGYTELKTYTLHIEDRQDVWYIEGHKVELKK